MAEHVKEAAEKRNLVEFSMAKIMLEGMEKGIEEGDIKNACRYGAENL